MINTQTAINKTNEFWKNFYTKNELKNEASSFALWCIENYIKNTDKILEIGCGNGRDSFTFIANENDIFAIDGCDVAIANNIEHLNNFTHNSKVRFQALDFNYLEKLLDDKIIIDNINIVYSRFVLHAIPEVLEDKILTFIYNNLPEGVVSLHEFRTNKDPLSKKGTTLSKNEMLTDHYRRFIDTDKFREKVKKIGFKEIYFIESNNLAVYKDDNPVVARIVLQKA